MQNQPFTDEEISEYVNRMIHQSVGFYESKISKELEETIKYRNCELPRQPRAGGANYVEPVVRDNHYMMRAQLQKIFCNGREGAVFRPQNAADVEGARIATEVVNYVVHRQNDSHRFFTTMFDDGLMGRTAVAKIFWDEQKKYIDKEFKDFDANAVFMAAQVMPNVDEINADLDPDTGTASGTLTVVEDDSQVRILNVAPENFGVEPEAVDLSDAFHFQRVLKTRAQIKSMGLDIKKLKDKQPDAGSTASQDLVTRARFRQIDTGYNPQDVDKNGKFWLYECYAYRDVDDRRKLFKIIVVADVVLDVEEVSRTPFFPWAPLYQGHSFWGDNFAKLSFQTQNANTMLTRGILDHTAITTNPRYMVAAGGLSKPSELLDNRLGGVVNVASLDSIAPLPQAQLNPFTFQTIEMLKANNEMATGISSLSQGLNGDAVSNQNSRGMVQDLVDLSMVRQEAIAREFAYGFLVPMYLEVYRLLLENEKRPMMAEVAGNWIEVDIKSWSQRKHAVPTISFTETEDMAKAQQLSQLLTMGAQSPKVDAMITPENYHKICQDIITFTGFKNFGDYITDPSQIPPKGPDPVMVAQMQIAQQQAQAGMMAAQADMLRAQTDAKHREMSDQIAALKAERDTAIKERDAARKDADIANKIDVAQRETALLEHQAANNAADTRGIISP